MYIEQLYTGCLAEAAYYIESEGEAVIIDPLRETEPYLNLAAERGAKIKYVFETHFHADFVSGHVDLAQKTGAKIVYGPTAKPSYDIIEAEDNQIFEVGKVKLKVLHTPGHTPESTCFLLFDENGKEHSIYTGDTLFIGDVGRPDLAQKNGEMTPEDMAATLYDSLRDKIMPLPDHITVYPGHGAGSACGKKMSDETSALLGDQKKMNYALGDLTKEEFIKELTTGILPPPQYFPKAAQLNKSGYKSIDAIFDDSSALSAAEVKAAMDRGALVIDTRYEDAFELQHIAGSWFIGLHGNFAPWAGALITDMHREIVILSNDGEEEQAITRLARVGYDNVAGYLKGGMAAWNAEGFATNAVHSIEAAEYVANPPAGVTIDVRKPSEYYESHLEGSVLASLDYIHQNMPEIEKGRPFTLHCKGGYRSVIFWSILTANGYDQLTNVRGGFDALKVAGAKMAEPEMA